MPQVGLSWVTSSGASSSGDPGGSISGSGAVSDEELTDASLRLAGQPMGAHPRRAAWMSGPYRRNHPEQQAAPASSRSRCSELGPCLGRLAPLAVERLAADREGVLIGDFARVVHQTLGLLHRPTTCPRPSAADRPRAPPPPPGTPEPGSPGRCSPAYRQRLGPLRGGQAVLRAQHAYETPPLRC
jgi:hypothetical protein